MNNVIGWLLLVITSGPGGANVSQIGPVFTSLENCADADNGLAALTQSHMAEARKSNAPTTFSITHRCTPVGNPATLVAPQQKEVR